MAEKVHAYIFHFGHLWHWSVIKCYRKVTWIITTKRNQLTLCGIKQNV